MWTSEEPQYTNSQTNGWLDEEEAFLDQMTFEQQTPTNNIVEPSKRAFANNVPFNYYSTNPSLQPEPAINTRLRSIMEIPKEYQPIYKFSHFNRMQSEAMDQLLHSDENTVVSAPTGTGKTALLEMAMIRCLSIHQTQQNYPQGSIKMIYMAPTKSLCAEKVAHWKNTFAPLGILCEEFTGDSNYVSMDSIKNSSIIVTTPEKWNYMTRRWVDHRRLVELIKLMMIDEIHILKEARGSTLEVCVSRMKTIDHRLRIVAVSATIPNLQNVTTWLNATALTFSEEYRPVRLDRYVYGYPSRGPNSFAFEKSLDWKLLDIIVKHGDNKPVLIFCSTRIATQSACDTLLKLMDRKNITSLPNNQVELKNKKLSGLVQRGIAFHHAGLDSTDRRTVEQLFSNRQIGIIATTSTLAVGVNLPAHLVIIKSTKGYQNGVLEDYSDIDILQMIGRAGRPGLDDSGCAVIMTTSDMEHKYISLVACQSIIESSLHRNLTEHLMSEICIGTVVDMESSVKWLESTFLCIRVKENPSHYQRLYNGESLTKNPDQVMHDICLKDMKLLIDHNLVSKSGEGCNAKHQPTFYGSTMDRYYIQFKTMVKIMQNVNWSSIKDVLELVCQSDEFETYRYNANEKTVLNELRSNADIRFPLKNKVSNVSDKVYILIQCILGDISLHHPLIGNSMTSISHTILQVACRITKCIIDCSAYEQNAVKLKHSLDLYQCMNAKMWSTSPFILRQIDGIGIQMAKNLSQKNISNFEQLRGCDSGRLELILHRNPPFGTKVLNSMASFPHYYLELKQNRKQKHQDQPVISLSVRVGLTVLPRGGPRKFGKGFFTVLWIETTDHTLVGFRRIRTENLAKQQSELTFDVQVTSPSMMVLCHLQNEDFVGLDIMKELKPDVDPIQFITLTNAMAQTTTATSPAQHDTDTGTSITKPVANENSALLDTTVDIFDETVGSKIIKVEPPSPPLEKKSAKSKKNDTEPCKHHCKDKRSCKHQCCKRGHSLDANTITSYSDFFHLSDNISDSRSNSNSKNPLTLSNGDNTSAGTTATVPLDIPPLRFPSSIPLRPSFPGMHSPRPTTTDFTSKTNINSDDDDDFDQLDLTLSPILSSTLDKSISLSPLQSLKIEDDDDDSWDITETSMNELLYSLADDVEQNSGDHPIIDNDDDQFGDMDLDMYLMDTDTDMDWDMDIDSELELFGTVPQKDNFPTATTTTATTNTTVTATAAVTIGTTMTIVSNQHTSCDWLWTELGRIIYEADNTTSGGDRSLEANAYEDGSDELMVGELGIGSTGGHGDETTDQVKATRLPNLVKWIHDQNDIIVE